MSWFSKLFGGGGPPPPDNRVGGAEARQLVADGALLLDVRTPAEFRSGHLDGALNVPVDQLARRMDELPRDRPIVVYCRSGARSRRASAAMAAAGLGPVKDLGPITAW